MGLYFLCAGTLDSFTIGRAFFFWGRDGRKGEMVMQNLPWPLNSRKAISIVVAIVVILVLLATGQMDGETAGTLITTLIVALVGTIAYEDAAAKKRPDAPVVTVNEAAVAKVEADSGGPVS
jgi:hypothetical protein